MQMHEQRIKNGWTLEHVGKKTGLTKTAIHEIEKGNANPSYHAMLKICKLFNIRHIEVEEFFKIPCE